MLALIIQFFCGLLIGLMLDPSPYYKPYNQLNNANEKLKITIQAIKSKIIKVKSESKRLLNDVVRSTLKVCGKILNLHPIRNLSWNLISHLTSGHSNPRLTRGKRHCLYTKELLPKKNHPWKTTVEIVKEWADKEKEKGNEDVNGIYNI